METNRVLSRVGARLLSNEELQRSPADFHRRLCLISILCRPISGDCQNPAGLRQLIVVQPKIQTSLMGPLVGPICCRL